MTNNLPTNWQELQAAIEQWGTDRNFYGEGGATYTGQWMKLVEEFGELVLGLNKNKPELIKDALGDMVVVLVHMNRLYEESPDCFIVEPERRISKLNQYTVIKIILDSIGNLHNQDSYGYIHTGLLDQLAALSSRHLQCPLFDCVLASYMEIKDRKGKMIDGKFIKNEDLN